MKKTTLPTIVLALFTSALLLPAAAVRADDTELAKQMEVIEKGMKKLKKSLKDSAENATSSTTIEEIKKAAVASRAQAPAMAAKMPESERAKFVEAYQKEMDVFIAEVDKLAAAVKDGKNEEAVAIHKTLGELEDKGHEKFTSDE